MHSKTLRSVVAVLILIITAGVFIYYFKTHPQAFHTLGKVPKSTLILLFVIYGAYLISLTFIQRATLALCDIHLGRTESFILTSYSTLINFFGPLQSGPAFRGVYLKRKHNVDLKKYGIATLLYYGVYAAISGLFVISALLSWWMLIIVTILGVGLAILLLKSPFKLAQRFRTLDLKNVYILILATLIQMAIYVLLYYTEIRAVHHAVKLAQAFVYAGAANFALFVSVTPGAIGFRESFLIFSERLHHLSSSVILSANLIDRSVYVIFLGMVFIVTLLMHAKTRLKTNPTTPESPVSSQE
jgi:uncharacterized membrane protein YbhN (UPF0104 family)